MTVASSSLGAFFRGMQHTTVLVSMLAAGTALAAMPPTPPPADLAAATANGVLRVRSAHNFADTVTRIEAAVRANKIRFFGEIDQSNLAATAAIHLRPSTLLLFGNPPLGVQLLTSNPLAGLDWPVRMLVAQDENGQVWVAYTDFAFIARRYGITDRAAVVAMATKVSALIAASTSGQ